MATSPFAYTMHVPASVSQDKKYPAVFALHGIGSTEFGLMSLFSNLNEEVIIIGIRGHLPFEKGNAYYYLKGYGNPVRELFDESTRLLSRCIDDITSLYPIDPDRRYLVGFSQGAILSLTLALTLGSKIKGIVPMHGYIPAFVKEEYPLQSTERLSVFLTDGQHDPIFPPRIGEESYNYLKDRVGSIQYKTYPSAHEITTDIQADVIGWIRAEMKASR